MLLFSSIYGALTLVGLAILTCAGGASAQNLTAWPLHDNGLNSVVQWDHYSFKVNGRRLFVFSGELHYWRIPVPEVWEELLEKIKAAGFTAFAFYSHWGYHNPNPSTLLFDGPYDFTRLFTIAKRVGLYVIVRPGPYVNAETNAGGFPGWLVTGAYGQLRNNDSIYTNAWTPFFTEYTKRVAPHLITNGGNVILYQIENEYGEQWTGTPTLKTPNPVATAYMELLEKAARQNGIDVPLIHNDPNMWTDSWSKDFSSAGGNVDAYGLDSYPSCWSCNLAECTGTNGQYVAFQTMSYYEHFQEVAPTQPEFFPEFQGGSYNPWGGPEGGCPNDIGADFVSLFYRDNVAQRVTAMSLYMMYGGTSWGALAAPVVATSYDYSAAISESRAIGSKFAELKYLALSLKTMRDITQTERIGSSTAYSTNANIQATELRNPETQAGFYITRHANSSSGTSENFRLNVNTSIGMFTIPQYNGTKFPGLLSLNGHKSKIHVTDFTFGAYQLIYSTAEILTYSEYDDMTVLAVWAPEGETAEIYIKDVKTTNKTSCWGCLQTDINNTDHGSIITTLLTPGIQVYSPTEKLQILIISSSSAEKFWAPSVSIDPIAPANETILVSGPLLVRSARYSEDGRTLFITGDNSVRDSTGSGTSILVWASSSVKNISWNGKNVNQVERNEYGALKWSTSSNQMASLKLPKLSGWKYHDSLPEIRADYSDQGVAWVAANHTTTPNPTKPGTLPVLYADDYGFHNGVLIWRGYFLGSASGATLTIQGGQAFGWSAWLNGGFIGSYLGGAYVSTGTLSLSFSNATVYSNQSNVLVILQDNNGHDLRGDALKPRGILSAGLEGNNFTSWRLAGAAGGESTILDPVRGIYNEGGLTAERLGWHLPGFDDHAWATTTFKSFNSSSASLGFSGSGVRFYRTTVPLNIPSGLDVSISFTLKATNSTKLRAQLFVNGYQYGRFNPWIGNQAEFPVPPGILDYAGQNTIGLSIWAQSGEGAWVEIDWKLNYILDSAFDARFDSSSLRPKWEEDRLAYV